MYIETFIKDGSIQKARSLATQFIDESNDESFKTKLRIHKTLHRLQLVLALIFHVRKVSIGRFKNP